MCGHGTRVCRVSSNILDSLSYLFLPRDGKITLCNITVNGSENMEKRFISNFAGARLVDCTPLIPRESSVSKETG